MSRFDIIVLMSGVNHKIWMASQELHGLSELLAHVNGDFATDSNALSGLASILARISKRLRRVHFQLESESFKKEEASDG